MSRHGEVKHVMGWRSYSEPMPPVGVPGLTANDTATVDLIATVNHQLIETPANCRQEAVDALHYWLKAKSGD